MIKSRKAKGRASVTFTLDPRVGAQRAAVCGEWNDWAADADVMGRDAEGGFSLTIDLQAGRAYRFRYLLDDQRWENDWAADAYLPNNFGGDDSVVDLTALAQAAPPTAKKAPAKTAGKAAAPATKPARRLTRSLLDSRSAAAPKMLGTDRAGTGIGIGQRKQPAMAASAGKNGICGMSGRVLRHLVWRPSG
jgi:hypothetical protein